MLKQTITWSLKHPALVLAHAARALAPHQRPRRVITLDALPLGPTGKIDRRAVAALLAAP